MEEEKESEEYFEHFHVTADKGQAILRIDKFLSDRLPNFSRNRIQQAAKSGNIKVNGNTIKSNYKVKPLDEISLVMPYPPRDKEVLGEDIPLDIIYEDDELLVINKAAGMVVHPGYGNFSGTLVNALVYHFDQLPELEGNEGRPGLVHRLDKNTTGLMVIAKTEFALSHLAKQFFDRTTDRRYQALVWGNVEEDEGKIESVKAVQQVLLVCGKKLHLSLALQDGFADPRRASPTASRACRHTRNYFFQTCRSIDRCVLK